MSDLYSPSRQILSGDHTRLGAHWDGEGTNFALFSAYADRVELCLFDPSSGAEVERIVIPRAGHSILRERGDDLLDAIETFLR